MSIKAYRLLRNNKEEGPFTADELVRKNLKPYDLIWIDGRSAAWSYPGEMPEFKNYVPVPGEETAKAQPVKEVAASVSPSIQAAIAVNDTLAQPDRKQKPRYKVSATWSKIQTVTAPVYKEEIKIAEPKKFSATKIVEPKTSAADHAKSLSWEEAWLDWEKEKVIPVEKPVKVKPVAVPQAKTINENFLGPALETKFAQPLDSLKDRYIENILQQKKSKKGFSFGKGSEFVIPCLALIVIFSVGYWLLNGSNKTTAILRAATPKTQQVAKTDNSNTIPANTPAENTKDNIPQNTNAQTSNNVEVAANSSLAKEPDLTDKAEDRKTNYAHPTKLISKQAEFLKQQNKFPVTQIALPDAKTTQAKTNTQQAKQFDPSVINNVPHDNTYNDPSAVSNGDLNAADARPTRRRTNGSDINPSTEKNEPTTTRKSNVKTSANYVSVPEYVDMADGSANLKIQNVSDVDLDLVVVDVQYFDPSGRFHKGETLYLHNLKAGKNITVKTPKDVNAKYATSKVSLVSSDANNVYVIGDN